ncbi:MAG: hypothetical protein MJ240_03945 [Kiritimatiellae bacterium]|nr:hypothetical protein [Kiritimatiellia bacterium]
MRFIVAMVAGMLLMSVGAIDYTWIGDLGGAWTEGTNFSPAAPDGGPGEGDTVTVNTPCALSQSDEVVLDKIDRLTFTGGKTTYLYAADGESVTLRCAVVSGDANSYLGKSGTGSLTIDGVFAAGGGFFETVGTVILGPHAQSDMSANSKLFRLGTGPDNTVTFAGPLTVAEGASLPTFQTRTRSLFKFAADNVFAGQDVLFQIGTASGFHGGLDLQGHDQEIGRLSFMPPKAVTATYAENHVLTSETAATLTITKGAVPYKSNNSAFSPVSGSEAVCASCINGGLTLKLAADGTGTGVFMVSNYTGYASSTTGSVICTSGTFTFLESANFTALSMLEKLESGNLVVQAGASINKSVELFLAGSGTLDISGNLAVEHLRLADGHGGWKYLPAKVYEATDPALEGHVKGSGRLLVAAGDPDEKTEYTVHTWTGAARDGLLTNPANWDVAPSLTSLEEILRFPADADYTQMPLVSGTVTAAGVEVEYAGGFTLLKDETVGGVLNLGTKALSFTDVTTEGSRETFYVWPDIVFTTYADHTIRIAANTKVSFYSTFSTPDSDLFHLRFDGPAVVLRGESVNCHFPMVFVNSASITCYRAHSFGLTRAEIQAPVIPMFRNTHVCATPWSVVGAFPSSGVLSPLVFKDNKGYPFEFQGAVSIAGTELQPHDASGQVLDYTGYVRLAVEGPLTFSGGLHVERVSRVQFEYADEGTLTFREGALTRGKSQEGSSGVVQLRFYGINPTVNTLTLADSTLTGTYIYPSRVTVVCENSVFSAAQLTPYVNSRVPDTDNLWAVLDLQDTVQEFARLVAVTDVTNNRYVQYPNATFDVTSGSGGRLLLNSKSAYSDTHVLRLTGKASLETCAPWTGEIRITNAVSTTEGCLKVGSGSVTFLAGAGWSAGTNVTVGAAGTLAFDAGSSGFEPGEGSKSKVNLCLVPGGTLKIADGLTLRVATCEVNGVRLAPGYYGATASMGVTALGDYLTGGGRLHVRSRSGLVGVRLILR